MGFFVSSKQAVVIALLFIGICVAIGLLAGLMKPPPSVNNGGSNDGQVGILIWADSRFAIMTSSNRNTSALLALCEGNSPVTGEFP